MLPNCGLPEHIPVTRWLLVGVASQQLWLCDGHVVIAQYPISTAANGLGEREGSEQTPRGWHVVRARIGANAPLASVFRGRRPTGEICSPELQAQFPKRDWILTRILWLSGSELGFNRGKNALGCVDSMRRYIYVHGTPESEPMGIPRSHGCIRMRNTDIVSLFDEVPAYAPVYISELA